VRFDLKPGEKRLYRGVWYKGKIKVNVAGTWHPDFHEPLWVMSVRVEPQQALKLYLKRMKIEQQFKDFKSLLHLEKLMNKSRENMEKMVALAAIAYAIGVLVGEKLRDAAYRRRGKKMGSVLGPVHPAEGVGKPKPD
jgi:transposase